MKTKAKALLLPVLALVLLAACVSAGKMLERAEDAWARGQYVEAINQALSSYEKAVDRNKDPNEIDAARSFLEQRFPEANANLSQLAERQLSGSDSEKANAWRTYGSLVSLNRRVKDSIASSFLATEDFNDELAAAKDVAAQLRYVEVLELMGDDSRESYIKAARIIDEIDSFVPDYRDIRVLKAVCIEEGTVTVAFSSQKLDVDVREGGNPGIDGVADDIYGSIRDFITANDHPEFLSFTSASTPQAAVDAGAVIFVELLGEVWVSAEKDDDYSSKGRIVWERSYGGDPLLIVTRLEDNYRVTASAGLDMQQALEIEFYPVKYETSSLTTDLYEGQFNNIAWMGSQLVAAQNALKQEDGEADMVVWAEMEYGGTVDFLDSAEVTGGEGTQTLPIDPAVYQGTATFINSTLPQFLSFNDINLAARLVNELTDAYLSDTGIREILANL